jgi:hypothetical protein
MDYLEHRRMTDEQFTDPSDVQVESVGKIRRFGFEQITIAVATSMTAGSAFASAAYFVIIDPPAAPHAWYASPHDIGAIIFMFTMGTFLASSGVFFFRSESNIRRAEIASLRARSLPDRAKHVAEILQEATELVSELQAELAARTVLLTDLQRQVAETNEQASDMEKLEQIDEDTARILDKYFDKRLESRLDKLERGARRREWLIGTAIAFMVGVGAALIAAYLLSQ